MASHFTCENVSLQKNFTNLSKQAHMVLHFFAFLALIMLQVRNEKKW